jgi:hypothetical protein
MEWAWSRDMWFLVEQLQSKCWTCGDNAALREEYRYFLRDRRAYSRNDSSTSLNGTLVSLNESLVVEGPVYSAEHSEIYIFGCCIYAH